MVEPVDPRRCLCWQCFLDENPVVQQTDFAPSPDATDGEAANPGPSAPSKGCRKQTSWPPPLEAVPARAVAPIAPSDAGPLGPGSGRHPPPTALPTSARLVPPPGAAPVSHEAGKPKVLKDRVSWADAPMRREWAYVQNDGRVLGPNDPRPPGMRLRQIYGRAPLPLPEGVVPAPPAGSGGVTPDRASHPAHGEAQGIQQVEMIVGVPHEQPDEPPPPKWCGRPCTACEGGPCCFEEGHEGDHHHCVWCCDSASSKDLVQKGIRLPMGPGRRTSTPHPLLGMDTSLR